jgi:Flp pilus assembly protein TadG
MPRARERGAVMVETVLLMPIVLLLVFGVVEFSFAFESSSVLADATRAAGRAGSAVGGEATYVDTIDKAASTALLRSPSGASPKYMIIYKANAAGYPQGQTGLSMNVYTACKSSTSCIALSWDGDNFVKTGGAWDPLTQERCNQPYDRIGVAIFMNFKTLTPLFAPFLRKDADATPATPMYDHAVFVFEPKELGKCP